MNVPDGRILLFKYPDYMVQQSENPLPLMRYGRNHTNTQKLTQQIRIKLVLLLKQIIVHIQCQHNGDIHIDELRSEVKISLQVVGIHNIHNHIGFLIENVFPHVTLLTGVIRKGVGSRQICNPEGVTLVVKDSLFRTNCYTCIVASVFPGSRYPVE